MEEKRISLVSEITTSEEEARLSEESKEALKKATELIKSAEEGSDGYKRVPLVTKIEEPKKKASAEEREFLILLSGEIDETGEELNCWAIATGRTEAYGYITGMMETDGVYVDLMNSFIVVEVETIKERKTCYDFLSYVINNELVKLPDGQMYPNLEDYIVGDPVSDDQFNME